MKTSVKKIAAGIAAVAALGGVQSALAYEAGDMVLRVGAATVDPREDSDEITVDGSAQPGSSVGVDSDTQIGITFTYMFSDVLGVEVLAATPFEHTIVANGNPDTDVATVKHLPPTVSVQYYPLGAGSAVQPYVGAGINYTTFFDEDLEDLPGDDIELDDSWGLALEAGVDYGLNDNWLVNASVWYVDIDTTAEITGVPDANPLNPDHTYEVDVEIDPWVYMISVGYKF